MQFHEETAISTTLQKFRKRFVDCVYFIVKCTNLEKFSITQTIIIKTFTSPWRDKLIEK